MIRPTWHQRCIVWWKEQVGESWPWIRWFVLGASWLLALGLGYAGFAQLLAQQGQPFSALDPLYLSLQLFVLNSGGVVGPKPWALDVARFLAPLIAAYTALQTLALLFHEQRQWLQLQFIRDHVVICGLGRKGYLLARGFSQLGRRVVVLEQDQGSDLVDACKEQGIIVLHGPAAAPEMLRQARVGRARYLIAVCGDDGTNAQIVLHVRQVLGQRASRPLTCALHVVDPQLCELLKERVLDVTGQPAVRLEFFNVFERGALVLLQRYPLGSNGQSSPPHLLVVGLGCMGENLVLHAARNWQALHSATGTRLRISVVDRQAGTKTASLCLRYPQLDRLCDITPLTMDVCWPEFQQAQFLFSADQRLDVTHIYVCLDDDSLALSATLTLHQWTREEGIPIVVRMEREVGLATLLDESGKGSLGNLHAFGLLDRTCTPELVLGGVHEVLARAIHEEYVLRRSTLGREGENETVLAAWQDLPEEFQESCRRQADHIGLKLHAIGCGIAPLTDWQVEPLDFTAAEVDQMARLEHERWMADYKHRGWTAGPKNVVRKTNPHLVPWEQLSEETQELNRDLVRSLPAFLTKAGLQVYRLNQQRPVQERKE